MQWVEDLRLQSVIYLKKLGCVADEVGKVIGVGNWYYMHNDCPRSDSR